MTIRCNPKLWSFHQAHDGMLYAAFEGDERRVDQYRERLDRLASAPEDDSYINHIYRQALEIVASPEPWAHTQSILDDFCRTVLEEGGHQ